MWSTSSRMRRARSGPTRSTFCRNKPHRQRVHRVADVDRERGAELPVQGRRAAARLAAVLDVVVHQECVVQHLEARGGGDGLARPAAEGPADGQAERGTKALARLRDERAQRGVEVLAGFGRRDRVVHGRERQVAVPGEALGEPGRAFRDIGLRQCGRVARFRPKSRRLGLAVEHRHAALELVAERRPAPGPTVRPGRRPPRAHGVARSSWSRVLCSGCVSGAMPGERSGDGTEHRVGCFDGGGRHRHQPAVPGQAEAEADRVVLAQGSERERLVQRPDAAARCGVAVAVEERVDGVPGCLVRPLHGRQVRVGPHVVGRQEQVRDGGGRVGAQPPAVHEVDQQGFGVGEQSGVVGIAVDGGVEEPADEVVVAQDVLFAGRVHRPLELAPHLPADLLPGVLGGAAAVRRGGVPVGDVHGEDALDRLRPVAVHRARPPDVDLGDAGERPLGVDVDRVSAHHAHRAAQVELHAVHPLQARVGELPHAGQARIGGQERGGEHQRRPFGGQRAHVVVAHERLGAAAARRPGRR